MKYVICILFLPINMKKISTYYILNRLAELGVVGFREEEFRRLFGLEAIRTHRVLHRLAAGGHVHRLANGRYVVSGPRAADTLGHSLFLATRLVEPSYVSFWTALNYYGWTEQAPRSVFVANTHRSASRAVEAHRIRLVKLPTKRFFGYEMAKEGPVAFPIAQPEKALVDSLYLPSCAGGADLVARALEEALPSVSVERLQEYGARMRVRTLASRLGYLLESHGVSAEALRTSASSTYVKLEPTGPRRGRFVARWRVIDNRSGGS